MSRPRGKYHYVNGKLRRRYNKHRASLDPKVHHLAKRKVVHNAEVVNSRETVQSWSDSLDQTRLNAILDGVWQVMTTAQKVDVIATKYFDPSNPAND